MCSAGASLPAIRRSHRAELVNTSKNFIAEISLTSSSRPLSFLSNISFSRRFAGLWFPSRRMFSRFQRTRGHPLTRCLQSLSDTGSDRCDFVINTICRPFLWNGHRRPLSTAEPAQGFREIFLKKFLQSAPACQGKFFQHKHSSRRDS